MTHKVMITIRAESVRKNRVDKKPKSRHNQEAESSKIVSGQNTPTPLIGNDFNDGHSKFRLRIMAESIKYCSEVMIWKIKRMASQF